MVATAFEFFDFFIIGFIISIIAPEWELTFGATATVLYAGGVGAIVGSFVGMVGPSLWAQDTVHRQDPYYHA